SYVLAFHYALVLLPLLSLFCFPHPASSEIYALSLHDALPICGSSRAGAPVLVRCPGGRVVSPAPRRRGRTSAAAGAPASRAGAVPPGWPASRCHREPRSPSPWG